MASYPGASGSSPTKMLEGLSKATMVDGREHHVPGMVLRALLELPHLVLAATHFAEEETEA